MFPEGTRIKIIKGMFSDKTGTIKTTPYTSEGSYGILLDCDTPITQWFTSDEFELFEEKQCVCECGTTKTMGRDDHPSYHSHWCPVNIKHLKYNSKC